MARARSIVRHTRPRKAAWPAFALIGLAGSIAACSSDSATSTSTTKVAATTTVVDETTAVSPTAATPVATEADTTPAATEPPTTVAATTTIAPTPTAAPTTTIAATTTTAGPRIAAGSTYVAHGSSFAAGIGIPTQGATCGRSDHNYPSLVATDLGLHLIDVSCSGATTANLIDTPEGDAAPQIDALTADTGLVTVTAGGNDVGYSGTTISCDTPGDCTTTFDQAQLETQFAALPAALDNLFAMIKQRSPQATVMLVTYPLVIPAAQCDRLSLERAEATLIAGIGTRLEAAFVAAAARDDVLIADPYLLSAGHGPCDAIDQRWIEGAVPEAPGFSFHPTANGHIEMAQLVEQTLAS